jgi:hypothetical protein
MPGKSRTKTVPPVALANSHSANFQFIAHSQEVLEAL